MRALAALLVAAPLQAQNPVPRGDADCSVTLTAGDVVSSVAALGGAEGCGNDDCDRDGMVTSDDVDCTLQCLFGSCPIPAAAAQVTSVVPEFGSGIAPLSTVRVMGTGFGAVDDPKFVTIGGLPADVLDVVDAETLLVLVPPLDPGPAEIVVNAGAVDGFPFLVTIAEAAPVGEPDSFDGVLGLVQVAVERFSQLPLEDIFGEDATLIRQQLARIDTDLAAQRAELAADPAFTVEIQAMFDTGFDSSGAAEELRELIAAIEALLASGGDEGGGAQSTADLERLRKALGVVITAAGGGATAIAGLAGAPIAAVVAIATALGGIAILLDAAVVAENPPLIVGITFTDANGLARPNPTAGGTARIEGMRFSPRDTTVRVATSRAIFTSSGEGGDGVLVVTLPDRFGFCGPVKFRLLRTSFGIRSNEVPARVQPELLDLSVDRARLRQPVTLQVRGTNGCEASALFRQLGSSNDTAALRVEQISNGAAQCLLEFPLVPLQTYRVRVGVGDLSSREEETLEVASALTGVSVSCDRTELALPPGSPSMMGCTCSAMPEGAFFTGTTISFAADGGTLNVLRVGNEFADVAAVGPGDAGSVTCRARFATNRPLVSQPFAVKVVDGTEPTVSLSEPPEEVDPGASFELTAMAADNDFVTRITLSASGDAVVNSEQQEDCTLLESNCTKTFTVQIKRGGYSNRAVTLRAQAFDGAGNEGVSTVRMFLVRELTETTPPVVTIQNPRNGGRVRAGDMVQVSVRVTDQAAGDSGVQRVRVDVTGPAVANGLVQPDLTLPEPLGAATRAGPFAVRPGSELSNITNRTITITATAFDAAGNMASDTITVMAGAAPVITSVFPSPAVAGEIIRIVGDGFGEEQGSSTVSIGGGVSGLTSWSNNEILALLPEDATGMATVVVTVDGVASNAFPFTVLGSGDVRITLIWDDVNDLDLIVTDPNNDLIFFGNRSSPSGGVLDVDANANCRSSTPSPRENIFWPTDGAPTGTYKVEVSYFRGCTKPPRPSPFTVNVVVDGRFMTLMEGSIGSGGRQSASFSR